MNSLNQSPRHPAGKAAYKIPIVRFSGVASIKRGGLPLRAALLLALVRSVFPSTPPSTSLWAWLTASLLVPGLGLAQTETKLIDSDAGGTVIATWTISR